jgi:3-oxoacyl-[acyl-carrier protein] reductase
MIASPAEKTESGPHELAGRVALVTGASRNIGRAIALSLAQGGASVIVSARQDRDGVEEVVSTIRQGGGTAIATFGDVSRREDVEAVIAAGHSAFGRLDILVNNAGTPGTREPIPFENLDAMTEDFWSTIVSTNLVGPFRCTRAAAGALRSAKGAVVSTASVAGLGTVGSSIAYGAAKAGLINMTKNLARALAPDVRVNAVAPGLVDSPWTQHWSPEKKAEMRAKTPLGRLCQPEDIADAILFLAAGSTMVTGHTLVVDGGLSF